MEEEEEEEEEGEEEEEEPQPKAKAQPKKKRNVPVEVDSFMNFNEPFKDTDDCFDVDASKNQDYNYMSA